MRDWQISIICILLGMFSGFCFGMSAQQSLDQPQPLTQAERDLVAP